MFKSRHFALLLAGAVAGCDLPSGPDEARDHLSRGKPRVVPVDLPLPAMLVRIRDQLSSSETGFSTLIDTSDMTLAIRPAPVSVALGPFLRFDPVDLQPIYQGYTPALSSYSSVVEFEAAPIIVSFPEESDSAAITSTAGGTISFQRDFSGTFSSATFGGGTILRMIVSTNDQSSLTGVAVALVNQAGQVVASAAPVSIPVSATRTIDVPLGGVTLQSIFSVRLAFQSSNGNGAGVGLRVRSLFANATITSASGVDASRVQPTRVTRNVALSANSPDFTYAELATGSVSLQSFTLGDLVFTPLSSFETNLAGKRVSATTPDSIRIDGLVSARPGMARVNIATRGQVGLLASNLSVRAAEMRTVSFAVDRRVKLFDSTNEQFRGVEEVTIDQGEISVILQNRLRVGGTVVITLEGATHANGAAVSQSVVIPASPDERAVSTLVTIPLRGVTLRPALLAARAVGALGGTNVLITSAAASDAFVADPGMTSLHASRVRVASASGLRFSFSQLDTLTAASMGLTDLTEMLKDVTLMQVDLTARIRNGAGIALAVDSLTLALVRPSDATPLLGRDGKPLRIVIDRAGTGSFSVAASATDSTTIEATSFVNELVQRVIAGEAVGLLATGRAGFGSASGTVLPEDVIDITLAARTPLDLAIPGSGVVLQRTSAAFFDLEESSADLIADLKRSLESGEMVLRLTNSSPFAVTASIALAPTPADTTGFDPFAAAEQISFSGIEMEAATVDANGVVSVPSVSSVTLPIQVTQLELFRQRKLGVAVRATIRPPAGGRARIGHDDYIRIAPTARLKVSTVETVR